jgi:hypothetical protein
MFFLQKSETPLDKQWVVNDGVRLTTAPAEEVIVVGVDKPVGASEGRHPDFAGSLPPRVHHRYAVDTLHPSRVQMCAFKLVDVARILFTGEEDVA